MEHTKEPWRVWGRTVAGPKGLLIEDQHGESICVVFEGGTNDAEDARRIVACVNACAGLPTERLEEINGGMHNITVLLRQRDELRSALEEIASDYADRFDMSSPSTNPGIKYVVKQARAAIAKATAQPARPTPATPDTGER